MLIKDFLSHLGKKRNLVLWYYGHIDEDKLFFLMFAEGCKVKNIFKGNISHTLNADFLYSSFLKEILYILSIWSRTQRFFTYLSSISTLTGQQIYIISWAK